MTTATVETVKGLKAPWREFGLAWKDPYGMKGGYWTLWHVATGKKVAELKNPKRGEWEVRWSQTKQVFKVGNHDQAIDYASQILGADYVKRLAEGYDMLDAWGWNEQKEEPASESRTGLKVTEIGGDRVVYLEEGGNEDVQ